MLLRYPIPGERRTAGRNSAPRMRTRVFSSFGSGILGAMLLAACGTGALDVTNADFQGAVDRVTAQPDAALVRLTAVEPSPTVRLVSVTERTTIFVRNAGGSLIRGTLQDIQPGNTVRVRTTGHEMRSGTPQYVAVWVEVTSPTD